MMVRAFLFLLLNAAIAWAAFQAGQRAESQGLRIIANSIGLFFCLLITITMLRYIIAALLILVGIP